MSMGFGYEIDGGTDWFNLPDASHSASAHVDRGASDGRFCGGVRSDNCADDYLHFSARAVLYLS